MEYRGREKGREIEIEITTETERERIDRDRDLLQYMQDNSSLYILLPFTKYHIQLLLDFNHYTPFYNVWLSDNGG